MAEETKFGYSLEDRASADASVLRLKGPIDAFSYLGLKAALTRWASGELGPKRRHLAVDFRDVTYCASSGWSVIFLQSTLLKEQKRGFVLFGLGSRAAHSLQLLEQRIKLVQVVADEAAAMAAVAQAAEAPAG